MICVLAKRVTAPAATPTREKPRAQIAIGVRGDRPGQGGRRHQLPEPRPFAYLAVRAG